MRRLVALVTLTTFTLAGCAGSWPTKNWARSEAWPSFPDTVGFELTTHTGTLPGNQLRYVVLPDATASLVELDVRVDVGAAADPPGKRGLAHLAEHVLFLGRPEGKARLESRLRAATVDHNAYTNLDSTHYQDLLLPDQLDQVIDLEVARFGASCRSVDPTTFARERDVVRNEARERHHGVSALDAIEHASYGAGHPYDGSVGGSDTEVAALTLDDVCAFVDAYYAPERLVVLVAGRVDAKATIARLNERFGALPARTAAPLAPVPPAHRGSAERRHLEADVDDSYLVWTYAMPPRPAVLGLESHLIVDDVQSVLGDALEDEPHAGGVQVFVAGGARAPIVVVAVALTAPAEPGPVARIVEERLATFSRGSDGPVAARILQHRYFMRLLFRLESLAERTDLFGDDQQLAPTQSFVSDYARLAADRLHLTDARSLYAPSRAARFLLEPRHGHAAAKRAQVAFTGEAREAKEDLDVDPAEAHRALPLPRLTQALPPARHLVLPNGMKVILQPAPGVIPMTVAKLVFAAGSAQEPEDKAGVAELAARTFTRGVWVSTPRLFHHYAHGRGGLGEDPAGRAWLSGMDSEDEVDDSTDVGPDATEITVRFPSRDAPDVLHHLAFRGNGFADPGFVEIFLRMTEELFHDARRGLGSVSIFAFAAGVFGPAHPYARTAGMTLRSLMRIEPQDVLAFIDRHYVAANATLVLAGAFDPDALEAGIRDEFGRWPMGRATPPVSLPARARRAPLFLGVATRDADDAGQVELVLGFPAPAGVDRQRAARLVLARMLDLRADAVRERIGASYGLSASLITAAGPGAYVVTGLIDPQRAGASLALLRDGIADLRAGRGFDEDFARARRAVLAGLLARSLSPSALAARWAFLARFGQAADYHAALAREVAALDPAKVRALVEAELAPGGEVVVVTGPRAAVEKAYADAKLPAPRLMKRWPPAR